MVSRQIFKCTTCGTRIMLRTQAGVLIEHPINIYCGNCNTLISGKASFYPESAMIKIDLDNAVPAGEEYPLFEIEISAELITNKLVKRNSADEVQLFSPYIRSYASLGHEGVSHFGERVSQFIYLKNNDWKDLKRINELWLNGKYEYLEKELVTYLPKERFPLNSKLEFFRGIHQLNLIFFKDILPKDYFKNTGRFLHKEIDSITKSNPKAFFYMARYFAGNNLLLEYEKRIFEIIVNFVNRFEQIIPALLLDYYDNPNLEEMGITTASFEDLKQFYIDAYESICTVIDLIEALNNIKHRNDYNLARPIKQNVKTLNDFMELNKGTKLNDYITGQETFDKLVFPKADNKIRNAIGHKSYSLDGLRQVITYYPKGKNDVGDKRQMYLIEFAQKCISLFQCALNLGELVYQIRKIEFIQDECISKPTNSYDSEPKTKLGRNDPCPCGSGKKYKKCCGNQN